jgi:hypothetical protein
VKALEALNGAIETGLLTPRAFEDTSKVVQLPDGRLEVVSDKHGYRFRVSSKAGRLHIEDVATGASGALLSPISMEKYGGAPNDGSLSQVGHSSQSLQGSDRIMLGEVPEEYERPRYYGHLANSRFTSPVPEAPVPYRQPTQAEWLGKQAAEFGPTGVAAQGAPSSGSGAPARELVSSQAWRHLDEGSPTAHGTFPQSGDPLVSERQRALIESGEGVLNGNRMVFSFPDSSQLEYELEDPESKKSRVLSARVHVPHLKDSGEHTYERINHFLSRASSTVSKVTHSLSANIGGKDVTSSYEHDLSPTMADPKTGRPLTVREINARKQAGLSTTPADSEEDDAYSREAARQRKRDKYQALADRGDFGNGTVQGEVARHRLRDAGHQDWKTLDMAHPDTLDRLAELDVGREVRDPIAERAKYVQDHSEFHPDEKFVFDSAKASNPAYVNGHFKRISSQVIRMRARGEDVGEAYSDLEGHSVSGLDRAAGVAVNVVGKLRQGIKSQTKAPEPTVGPMPRARSGPKPGVVYSHDTPIEVHGGSLQVPHTLGERTHALDSERHPEVFAARTVGELHEALSKVRITDDRLAETAETHHQRARGGTTPRSGVLDVTVHGPEGPESITMSANRKRGTYSNHKGEVSRAKKNDVTWGVYHPHTDQILKEGPWPKVFATRQSALDAVAERQGAGEHPEHLLFPIHGPSLPRAGEVLDYERPPLELAKQNMPRYVKAPRVVGFSAGHTEHEWGSAVHRRAVELYQKSPKLGDVFSIQFASEAPTNASAAKAIRSFTPVEGHR